MPKPRPPRRRGLAHLFAAIGCAWAGVRRLWHEAAFRQEIAGAVVIAGLFAVSGVGAGAYAVALGLFLGLVAAEALNTAIEVVVDHLSPDWSEFARDAKDLAGLAVACLVIVNIGFAALTLWRAWMG
jgi:diacylglycerol kinase (ATP)